MQNIMLPVEIAGEGSTSRARELVGLTGLKNFEGYYPNQISGGMQQRAVFARTLLSEPPVLLMDEPFGALDEITRTHMGMELLHILQSKPSTVLFVTHSIAEAVLLSDRVVVLSAPPSTVEDIVTVNLPRPRTVSMQELPAYKEAITCIQKSIYAY